VVFVKLAMVFVVAMVVPVEPAMSSSPVFLVSIRAAVVGALFPRFQPAETGDEITFGGREAFLIFLIAVVLPPSSH
jgi:hypothetical protein